MKSNKKQLNEESLLRKLARSSKWLSLYSRAKEIHSLKLFDNDSDFSQLQIDFIRQLELLSGLYTDVALGEEFICDEVVEDVIRSEAYLLYKSKKRDEEKMKRNCPQGKSTPKDSIIFTQGTKGKK
jgi:hypothetical protein